jgi:hypothetical protein
MSATPVNLYVDRFMQNSPNTAEELWNATKEHSKIFADGARKVGLTGAEYSEFQEALLDGKAIYVRLPTHMDAMAGLHHGHAYAVKSVTVPANTLGWKVALSDGTLVYVPQICGNLSVVHGVGIAHHPGQPPKKVAGGGGTPPPQVVTQGSNYGPPPGTPVTFDTPPPAVSYNPVYTPSTPEYTAPVYVPPVTHSSILPFLIPIVAFVGGTVGSVSSPPTTIVPGCSQGSNLLGVCQAGR